jgi:hypothetical protein
MGSETIELSQHILGMQPYVLIEASADPDDGELVLSVKAGGGAAEQIGALPLMMLGNLPAADNPLTQAVAELLAEEPAPDREALRRFADYVGFPMPDAGL